MVRTNTVPEDALREIKHLRRRIADLEASVSNTQKNDKSVQSIIDRNYQAAFESANDVIVLMDKQGRVTDVNGKLKEILGYDREELLSRKFDTLKKVITNQSVETLVKNFNKRIAGQIIPPYEIEMVRRDGQLITLEVNTRSLMKDNKLIGDIAILRDITERKLAEREIQNKTQEIQLINSINEVVNKDGSLDEIVPLVVEKTQKLFNGSAAVIYFLSHDKQYLVVRNFNVPRSTNNVIEQRIGTNIPEVRLSLKPGGFFNEIMRTGKANLTNDTAVIRGMAIECIEDEAELSSIDAVLQSLDVHSVMCAPLISGKQEIGLIAVSSKEQFTRADLIRLQTVTGQLVNVIKRKMYEDSLVESESRLRTMMEASSEGFALHDGNIVMDINDYGASLFGCEREELIGKNANDFIAPESHDLFTRNINISFNKTYGAIFRKKDGTTFPVELKARNIMHNNEEVRLVSFRDMTAQKKYENLLENIVVNAPIAMYIEQDRKFKFVNKWFCRDSGYSESELLAMDAINMVWPEDRDIVRKRTIEMLKGKRSEAFRFRTTNKAGEKRWVMQSVASIIYNNRRASLASYVDITEQMKAEQKLRESERNYRALAESITDIFFAMDNELKYVYWNKASEKLTGVTADEAIGKHLYDIFPDTEETRKAENTYRKAIQTNSPQHLETPYRIRDREYIFDINAYPSKTGVSVFVRDITEKRQAEKALKSSEDRFRRLADNARDIIFRFRTTSNPGYDYMSPAVLRISGYTPEEFYRDSDLIFKIVHPDDLAYLKAMTSRPQDFLDKPVTLRWISKEGKTIWTEQRAVPIYDENNNVVAIEGITRDITERKLADEELKESQRNLQTYMDNAPDGICSYDPQGILYYGNKKAEEILGYQRKELIGKSFLTLNILAPDYLIKAGVLLALNAKGASTGPDEFELIKKDGSHTWVEISTAPIKQKDKVLVLSFIREINDRKRAEEALKASEKNYRNSIDASPLGAVVFTTDEKILYANQAVLDMYGYKDVEELRNTPVKERQTEESYAEYLIRSEKFKKGELTSANYEIGIIRKDGTVKYLGAYRRDMVWNGQRQFQILYNDITERKKAVDEIRESRARFKDLAKLLPLAVWETDENGFITYTNDETMRLFGYSIQDTAPNHYLQNLIPVDRARAANNVERIMKGETIGGIDYTGIKKDGSTFPELIYASAIIRNGEGVGLRGITIDVSKQKFTEKQLEQAAQDWRVTFDSLTDMVCILDNNFRISRVNRAYANVFNKEPQELLGKVCYELLNRDCPYQDCPHRKTLQTGKSARAEFYEPTLRTHVEVSTSPIFDENGRVKGTVHIMRDISERKQMEQQLILTDRLASVGELASGVAHELNNPLTSVIGFSQLLMEGEIPNNIKEDLSLINSEAQRAASVVKNLLTFARKHAAVKQPTKINSVIEDVLKLRAYEQKVNNIEVIKKFATDLPEIMVDYFQIQQVFLNLIINAEFFMTEAHKRGLLTITTERNEKFVRISFEDDGPGIPHENLNRIFDPFFTTKEVGKGTGLGLSICHGIITEHGGIIKAESEAGKGATFVIELPVNDCQSGRNET